MNPCVELDGLLAERASGELAPEDQARLDAHLPSCERCRAELAGYEDALDLMRVPGGSTSRDTVAPSPSPRAEGRGPGTGAPTERGREHPDLALSTLAAWGRYRRRRIAGLALGAGLLSMAAAAALALAPGLFAKRVPHALETAAPGAVSEPDLAVSEPDLAVSEPDLAVSEPDLAVSEPDLAVSEPDLAVSEPDVDESVEASALASSQDEEEITSEDVALAALDAAEQP